MEALEKEVVALRTHEYLSSRVDSGYYANFVDWRTWGYWQPRDSEVPAAARAGTSSFGKRTEELEVDCWTSGV